MNFNNSCLDSFSAEIKPEEIFQQLQVSNKRDFPTVAGTQQRDFPTVAGELQRDFPIAAG